MLESRLTRTSTALAGLMLTALVSGAVLVVPGPTSGAPPEPSPRTPPPASRGAYAPVPGPIGQSPISAGATSSPIRAAFLAGIRNAARGSTIHFATWNFDDSAMADALVEAHEDGVSVWMIVPRANCGSDEAERVHLAIGLKFQCSTNATRGDARGMEGEPSTTMHQKSITFSRTGSADDVAIVTSYNATDEARLYQYNTAFQFVETPTLVDHLNELWAEQWVNKVNPVACGHAGNTVGRLRQWFWGSYGVIATPLDCKTADPILDRLNSIPNRSGAVVLVSTSGFGGPRGGRIAEALADLKRDGATVRVIHTLGIAGSIRATLDDAQVSRLNTQRCAGDSSFNHSKMILMSFVTGGDRVYRSWVGSEQLSSNSMGSDELTVQVPSQGYFDAFRGFYNHMWSTDAADC